MNKKTKTTTNSTANTAQTTTPNAPSWVTGLSESFAGQIPGLKTQTAGLSGLEQDAMAGLSGQDFGGLFGDAAKILSANAGGGARSISGGDALQGVDKWLSPYLSDVVNATAADLDASAGAVRAQQDLDIVRNNAFGGSGSAIKQSMTEGELARARAASLGGLRQEGFMAAANLSQAEEARKLQARIAEAQAAAAAASNANAAAMGLLQIGNTGLNQQAGLGGVDRGVTQAQLNQPITDAATQIGLFGQLPADLLTGQTTTGTVNQTGKTTETTSGLLALLEAIPAAPAIPA